MHWLEGATTRAVAPVPAVRGASGAAALLRSAPGGIGASVGRQHLILLALPRAGGG